MKKNLLYLCLMALLAVPATVFAGPDFPEKFVTEDQLPAAARKFLSDNFKDEPVVSVKRHMILGYFDVLLKDGTEVEFVKSGVPVQVEAPKGKTLPESVESILPDPIPAYLKKNYPGKKMRSVTLDNKKWEIEIEGLKMELIFDSKGNYLGMDD